MKSRKQKASYYDSTYGQEPDLLDQPGVIVEPDVRKKIADYFKKMLLREIIQMMIKEK